MDSREQKTSKKLLSSLPPLLKVKAKVKGRLQSSDPHISEASGSIFNIRIKQNPPPALTYSLIGHYNLVLKSGKALFTVTHFKVPGLPAGRQQTSSPRGAPCRQLLQPEVTLSLAAPGSLNFIAVPNQLGTLKGIQHLDFCIYLSNP